MFSIISVCLLDPSPSGFCNLHHRHPACCIMSDIFHMLWILICGINKIFWSLGRYDPPLKVLQQRLQATSDWWRSIKVLWGQCQRAAYSHLQRFLYFGGMIDHMSAMSWEYAVREEIVILLREACIFFFLFFYLQMKIHQRYFSVSIQLQNIAPWLSLSS